MPTNEQILQIIEHLRLTLSTQTTQQQYAFFLKNNLIEALVFTFPLIAKEFGKGHVLAFETLISKAIVQKAIAEEYELEMNEEVLSALRRGRF